MKWSSAILALAIGCLAPWAGAQAAEYPSKPITIIVGYPPGGGVDKVGRLLATELSRQWKQSVVVDNRPGAAGTIGAAAVARAAADGYTLMIGGTGPQAVAPVLMKELTFSPTQDLQPVSLLAVVSQVLVASPSLGVRTVEELLAKARREPGQLKIASGGYGTGQHLAAAMLMQMAGIELVHVPYKGTTAALNDLLGGHVDLLFADPTAAPFIADGRLVALGISSQSRNPVFPDVAPLAENGIPGYHWDGYYNLTVPAGTPQVIQDRLNSVVGSILADDTVRQKMLADGLVPVHSSVAEAVTTVQGQMERVRKLLADHPDSSR